MQYWKLMTAIERRKNRRLEAEIARLKDDAALAEAFRAEGLDPSKNYTFDDAAETFTEKAEPKA